MSNKSKKILLVGGGTGGHVIPVFEIYRQLKKKDPDLDIVVVGNGTEIEKKFFNQINSYKIIHAGKLHRYFTLKNLAEFYHFIVGYFQAYFLLKREQPAVIFSKGGYAALPIISWAKKLGIPYFIHESDIEIGSTNKMFADHAVKVFVGFPVSNYQMVDNRKLQFCGQVLREETAGLSKGKYNYGFTSKYPVVLITGGSQGSKVLNKAIFDSLSRLTDKYNIIHQTGETDFHKAKEAKQNLSKSHTNSYFFTEFFHDSADRSEMIGAIENSDLIVARAGANTIGEVAMLGKPMLLVPYKYASNDHQTKNAKFLESAGAAIVLRDDELDTLSQKIDEFFSSEKTSDLGKKAGKLFPKNGAEIIADEILKEIV